jgi:hypothetical protein
VICRQESSIALIRARMTDITAQDLEIIRREFGKSKTNVLEREPLLQRHLGLLKALDSRFQALTKRQERARIARDETVHGFVRASKEARDELEIRYQRARMEAQNKIQMLQNQLSMPAPVVSAPNPRQKRNRETEIQIQRLIQRKQVSSLNILLEKSSK